MNIYDSLIRSRCSGVSAINWSPCIGIPLPSDHLIGQNRLSHAVSTSCYCHSRHQRNTACHAAAINVHLIPQPYNLEQNAYLEYIDTLFLLRSPASLFIFPAPRAVLLASAHRTTVIQSSTPVPGMPQEYNLFRQNAVTTMPITTTREY